jgi:hypothetical protein
LENLLEGLSAGNGAEVTSQNIVSKQLASLIDKKPISTYRDSNMFDRDHYSEDESGAINIQVPVTHRQEIGKQFRTPIPEPVSMGEINTMPNLVVPNVPDSAIQPEPEDIDADVQQE